MIGRSGNHFVICLRSVAVLSEVRVYVNFSFFNAREENSHLINSDVANRATLGVAASVCVFSCFP